MSVNMLVLKSSLAVVLLVTFSVVIHESVHVYQCSSLGGTPRFVWDYTDGYDFLKLPYGSLFPSPAVTCLNLNTEALNWWNGKDWLQESGAFFWQTIVIIIGFPFIVISARRAMKKELERQDFEKWFEKESQR